MALLIGGQLLFASKTFDVQKVALNESIQMTGSKTDGTNDASTGGNERIAMRVPTEEENNARPSLPVELAGPNSKPNPSAKDGSAAGHEKSGDGAPPSAPAEPTKKRLVKFLGGRLTLDVYQHPVIGSREAPHIAIEMVSYDCPHCRKMFPFIEHALERYGDQVALLVMVQPLDNECNKLVTDPAASHPGACATARLALGIARVNPSSFATFHDFLMSGDKDKPPPMGATLPKAHVLADRSRLRQVTQSAELEKQLDGYVDLFGKLQKQSGVKGFGLPVQILGDHVMNGSVEKEEDLFKAWEEHLGVKPK
jgi:protein-disulfide isomerase